MENVIVAVRKSRAPKPVRSRSTSALLRRTAAWAIRWLIRIWRADSSTRTAVRRGAGATTVRDAAGVGVSVAPTTVRPAAILAGVTAPGRRSPPVSPASSRSVRAFARRTAACEMRWLISSCEASSLTPAAPPLWPAFTATGRGVGGSSTSGLTVLVAPTVIPGPKLWATKAPPQRSPVASLASSQACTPLTLRTAACEMR